MKTKQKKGDAFKSIIEKTLHRQPDKLSEWVYKKIKFIFPDGKMLGCAVYKKETKRHDGIIYLSDEFLNVSETYQEWTILHEIAHIKLKHSGQRNFEMVKKQESEAYNLAWTWLSNAYEKEFLEKSRLNFEKYKKEMIERKTKNYDLVPK